MPTRERPSPVRLARRHLWWIATAGVLAVVLVAVSLLGGWARSAPEGPVTVAPGSDIDAAPLVVRLDRAVATFTVAGRDAEPGQAFVVAEGQVELTEPLSVGSSVVSDTFTADLTDALDPYGAPTDVAEATVRVATDGSNLLGMGPGLRYDVQAVFIVAEGSVPEEMTVTVHEHTWRPSSLDGDLGWFDAAPIARVPLEVAPLPATRPEPEEF